MTIDGPDPRTVHELLVRQADDFGTAPAIICPDRPPLDYAALLAEVERTAGALAAAGSRAEVASPLRCRTDLTQ